MHLVMLAEPSWQLPVADLPHPALLRLFEGKVAGVRTPHADPVVRYDAAEIVRSLIERVTIHIRTNGREADVEASLSMLAGFARNANPDPLFERSEEQ